MYFQPDYANLQDYYPFGMLIADRTYTFQTCSTVWVESNTEIYSDVQNQGHGWHSINSGSFIPDLMAIEVTSGGNNGDGAEFHFEVAHNDKEVTIDFDYLDLSNLSPFSQLSIELLDSADNVLYFTNVFQSALYQLQAPITFNATDCGTGYRLRFTLNGASNMDYISMGAINISQEFVSNNVVCDAQGYRFGFNGMEKDDERSGVGNGYTTEFRQYDPRLGRWFSTDPKASVLPWQSPYSNNNSNPISYKDPKGDFGLPGALVGGGIGFVGSLTKSVIQDGWGALKDGRTYAKAGVNMVAGAIVGATGGLVAGIVATGATMFGVSLAEDAIDGNELNYGKAGFSSLVSTATFGLAKFGADKLGGAVISHWWNRGNTNAIMRWVGRSPKTNVAQLMDRAGDLVGVATACGVDSLFPPTEKVVKLKEVVVRPNKQSDDRYIIPENEGNRINDKIQQNIGDELGK